MHGINKAYLISTSSWQVLATWSHCQSNKSDLDTSLTLFQDINDCRYMVIHSRSCLLTYFGIIHLTLHYDCQMYKILRYSGSSHAWAYTPCTQSWVLTAAAWAWFQPGALLNVIPPLSSCFPVSLVAIEIKAKKPHNHHKKVLVRQFLFHTSYLKWFHIQIQ